MTRMSPIEPTIAWVTLRQLFVRRRLIVAGVFALLPLVIAVVFVTTHAAGDPSRVDFPTQLFRDIILDVLLPLVTVVLGTSAFGAEVEDGTLVYLLVKPTARWRIVLTRFVIAALSSYLVVLPMLLLPWIVLAPVLSMRTVVGYLTGSALAVTLYSVLFVTLGFLVKRALVVGLLYIVVIELVISQQVAGVKSLSIREFATTVIGRVAAGEHGIVPGEVSLTTVLVSALVIVAVVSAVAILRLTRYELAERV